MLTYKNDTHEYFWEEKKVPGVNEILKAEGIIPDFGRFPNSEYKRQLGTYVHDAIRLYFGHKLDENSLQGEVKTYFEGFLLFMKDFELNPFEVEKPLYSKAWGFAGTPDCFDHRHFDWKCTLTTYPYYEICMGGYDILIEEHQGVKPEESFLVKLQPGKYKVKPIVPNRDLFLAIYSTYLYKTKRKLYKTNN